MASSKIRSDCVVNSPAAVPFRLSTVQPPAACELPARAPRRAGQPMFIGIGGGRGAGKEFTCRHVIDKVRERGFADLAQHVVHLHLDDFHKQLGAEDRALVDEGRAQINYDHPQSYDFELLTSVMHGLKRGDSVDIPQWDRRQKRHLQARTVAAARVVLVEGTLVLFAKQVRELLDMQVFVDVDSDTRLGRQVRAELQGMEGPQMHQALGRFLDDYLFMSKPSFEEFIFPTKRWADVIIPKGDRNHVAIELIAQRLIDLDSQSS
ncbi:hypothetical protein LPJ78_000509 [Coemansia sp. RSA 989]|nr:P-loop containing nucleoside triphosphate hydrolase protein [Coemansia mojavensis]KAJ1868012.1 hypothetical protein LPJ78_000509 [Coemansia sp. RSA 989]KAJ1875364.1 hypothetical protein LPJ55_000720 [Coemansia sp. RSA 990]KAJ2674277.1 hypothetical protein IWW42_001777 [Coemansia sp. RSA 1085]